MKPNSRATHSTSMPVSQPRAGTLALAMGIAVAALCAAAPAQAQGRGSYAYCLTSPGYGYPGECSYATYAQCRASASGRRADCVLNPVVGFSQPRREDYRTYRGYDNRW